MRTYHRAGNRLGGGELIRKGIRLWRRDGWGGGGDQERYTGESTARGRGGRCRDDLY